MSTCNIFAPVRNPQGFLTSSNLHKGLLKIASRPLANDIYLHYSSMKGDYDVITLSDENNEATLNSLLEAEPLLPLAIVGKEGTSKVFESMGIDANNISEDDARRIVESPFGGIVTLRNKGGKITHSIPNTQDKSSISRRAYNRRLNLKIKEVLKKNGIAVDTLDNLEERLIANGYTDFSITERASDGLLHLIKVAKGMEEYTLPEEFAHFAIETNPDNVHITRLIDALLKNDLYVSVLGNDYEQYRSLYNDDRFMLAKEAAGKLVAKSLMGEHIENYSFISNNASRGALEKVSSIQENDIRRAINDAYNKASVVARMAISSSIPMDINKVAHRNRMYQVNTELHNLKDIIEEAIAIESKKFQIAKESMSFEDRQKFKTEISAHIETLKKSIDSNTMELGIINYLTSISQDLVNIQGFLFGDDNNPGIDNVPNLNDKAKILNSIRTFYFSNRDFLDSLIHIVNSTTTPTKDTILRQAREMKSLFEEYYAQYAIKSEDILIEFITPFIGDKYKEVLAGKDKKEIAKKLLNYSDKDVSMTTRLLDSLAQSGSEVLSILDNIIKLQVDKARQEAIVKKNELLVIGRQMESDGIDTSKFYERDSKGNLTGDFITKWEWSRYKKDRRAYYESLKEKNYTPNKIRALMIVWDRSRKKKNKEGKVYLTDMYKNPRYEALSAKEKEYLNKILAIKKELDSFLPNATKFYNAPKILKDVVERAKEGSKKDLIYESIKDQFIQRTNDTEFGISVHSTDFEGRQVNTLPLLYQSLRENENMNDLSTDVISTMIAYSDMALRYKHMNDTLSSVLLMRDYMEDNHKVVEKSGMSFLGFGIQREAQVYKDKSDRQIIQMMNDHIKSKVFGIFKVKGSEIAGVSTEKTLDFLGRMTAINSLGFNLLSGVSNLISGVHSMNIEAVAQQYFKTKDLATADGIYAREIGGVVTDIGSRGKHSKITLFNEMFNILQDADLAMKDIKFTRNTRFGQLASMSSLFFISNAGEHFMQTRTGLTLAVSTPMLDDKGKSTNLWESLETVPIDPNNPEYGSVLRVKEGYTKADGSEFTSEDIFKFTRKAAGINQYMHGIYNNEDKATIQKYALGRLAMLFRKWIVPAMNRRFAEESYNRDLQEYTEGYYRTTGNFLKSLYNDLQEGKLAIRDSYRNLSEMEQANLKRAFTELFTLLLLSLLLYFFFPEDDDEEQSYMANLVELMLRRTRSEIGALAPTPLMISDAFRILKSPSVAINTAESIIDLPFTLMNPYSYETVAGEEALVEKGRYKGYSEAEAAIRKTPLFPMYNTILKTISPEESLSFYQ